MAQLPLLSNIPIARNVLRRPVLSLRAILRSRSPRLCLLCAFLGEFFRERRQNTVSLALQPDEVDICAVYDMRLGLGPPGIILLNARNLARELTVLCA